MALKRISLFLPGLLVALSLTSYLYVSYQESNELELRTQSLEKSNFTPEELREDIAYFGDLLARVHPREIPSFPLGDIQREIADLTDSLDRPLGRHEFFRRLAPIANLLNDEHTIVFPAEPDVRALYENGHRLFPFDVVFLDNKLYIAGNLSDEKRIRAGMEIVSINGTSANAIQTTLKFYYSGTRDEQKLFYLQQYFREALSLMLDFEGSFQISVSDSLKGEISSFRVIGKEFSEREAETFRYEIIAPDTILFTYNAFEDDGDKFGPFLLDLFSTARENDIQNLIIDIRKNQGGASAYGDDIFDYLVSEPYTQMTRIEVTITEEVKSEFISYVPAFLRWLPVQYVHPFLRPLWLGEPGATATVAFEPAMPEENPLRFSGSVYLLTGPGTMSSASLFAATIQKYNIGTLVGEATGGYATMYGNVIDVYLPNTGLKVWMPTSVVYGNTTGPVVPEFIVIRTVQDLAVQRDAVLEFAKTLP